MEIRHGARDLLGDLQPRSPRQSLSAREAAVSVERTVLRELADQRRELELQAAAEKLEGVLVTAHLGGYGDVAVGFGEGGEVLVGPFLD